MQFRQDINGMRAIAVIAVVLYHFDIPGCSGGFAGVDIFFVISGYLMTRIIVSRIEADRFSLPDFYLDRARRIVPALAVLCAALLAMGWFLLPPTDYRVLGRHSFAALAFLSNIAFYREAGYFDAGAHEKWLLHSWSLGVEWQFYILYPLLLIGLFRVLGRNPVRLVLAGLAMLSLVASIVVTSSDASGAFYLLPTRAWEMIAGGLVYLYPVTFQTEGGRRAAEWIGIGAAIVAMAVLRPSVPWPGWRALIPVAAAMLVLAPARAQSRLLGNPVVSWVGRSSYSIYLWHWPTVVALVFFERFGPLGWRMAGIALSFGLGGLSYHFVENRTRNIGRPPRGVQLRFTQELRAHASIVAMIVPAAAMALWAWRGDGIPARVPERVLEAEGNAFPDPQLAKNCFDIGDVARPCILGGEPAGRIGAILIGDSHALAVAPAVRAAMTGVLPGVLYFRSYPGCATVEGAGYSGRRGDRCLAFNEAQIHRLLSREFRGVPVLIANSWRGYFLNADLDFTDRTANGTRVTPFSDAEYRERATATICRIAKVHPTFLMAGYPDWEKDVPRVLARRLMRRSAPPDIVQLESEHRRRHAAEAAFLAGIARECGVGVIDPAEYVCRNGVCFGTADNLPLYRDAYHMNDAGAAKLVPMFRKVFASFARVSQPLVGGMQP